MKTPRAVLYLRQSVSREDSISLEIQEVACRAHCEAHGYVVVAVESDPGISGRTWKRPAVQRVMAMVEERDADVVILWKWSRLSRSRLDWAVANDKIETAGGRIESATEPLDTSTATGRFARGMMTEMAAFESERIGDVWRESQARRVRAGLPANGRPRFGYAYIPKQGFTPDPITGPVLADLYRRYIAGESVFTLVTKLNAGDVRPSAGYGPQSGGLWSDKAVRRVLDSGFGAGLISYKQELLPGIHEPVITPDEWEAYRAGRVGRRRNGPKERSVYLFSGMIRCYCGGPMGAGLFGTNRTPKYRCDTAMRKRTHPQAYIYADVVEAQVLDWLDAVADELAAEAVATINHPDRPRPAQASAKTIALELVKLTGRMDKLGDLLLDGTVSREAYTRTRKQQEVKHAELEAALLQATVQDRVAPDALVVGLRANWDAISLEHKRGILRELIGSIRVDPDAPKARVSVVPSWVT